MPKKHILLVEQEAQNRRLLEVSLSKAGFTVDVATSANEALAKADVSLPNLIISGTELENSSGFDLCASVRARAALAKTPFIFLSEDSLIASKVRGLELGADDYLIRPIYIKDLVSRIEILLARLHRDLNTKDDGTAKTMQGNLKDISLIEIMRGMAGGAKDGTARIDGPEARGHIWFKQGEVIDASVNNLQGEAALFRMMHWSAGHFEIDFAMPERIVAIRRSVAELINESLNQTEIWQQLISQLPPLTTVCTVNFDELADRLGDLPDSHTALIRQIDGERSIIDVVRSATLSDVNALRIFSQLFFEGLLSDSGHVNEAPSKTNQSDLALKSLADAVVDAIEDTPSTKEVPRQATVPLASVTQGALSARNAVEKPSAQETGPPPTTGAPPKLEAETPAKAIPTAQSSFDSTDSLESEAVEASSHSTPLDEERSFWDLAESTRSTDDVTSGFDYDTDSREEFPAMDGGTVSDLGPEDDFFETSQATDTNDDDFEFDDEMQVGTGAKKTAFTILGVVLLVVVYLAAQDRIKPLNFERSVLNDKWADTEVRKLPPIAKSVPLDAGWTVPNLGDAGLLPPALGARDTYAETRQKPKGENGASENSDQAAMKPVKPEMQGETVEAGNTTTPSQRKKANALIRQSKADIDQESFQQAAAKLEKSLALDPSNLTGLRLNALVQVELDNMEDAIEFALKAIRLGAPLEDAAQLYQLLGQAHQSLGRKKEAKTAYENFLQLAPKSKNRATRESAQYIRQLIIGLGD